MCSARLLATASAALLRSLVAWQHAVDTASDGTAASTLPTHVRGVLHGVAAVLGSGDATVYMQYLQMPVMRFVTQVNFVLFGLLAQIVANAAEAIRLSLVQVIYIYHTTACDDVVRSSEAKQLMLRVAQQRNTRNDD